MEPGTPHGDTNRPTTPEAIMSEENMADDAYQPTGGNEEQELSLIHI